MIKNISTNGEEINLRIGVKYLVIDALYMNDIKSFIGESNFDIDFEELKSKVFPFNDTPFALITPISETFEMKNIKKVLKGDSFQNAENIFTSDTGLILFISLNSFTRFTERYVYEDLVNSDDELINVEIWNSFREELHPYDCGLILSPGKNSGLDFTGSGVYRIASML